MLPAKLSFRGPEPTYGASVLKWLVGGIDSLWMRFGLTSSLHLAKNLYSLTVHGREQTFSRRSPNNYFEERKKPNWYQYVYFVYFFVFSVLHFVFYILYFKFFICICICICILYFAGGWIILASDDSNNWGSQVSSSQWVNNSLVMIDRVLLIYLTTGIQGWPSYY